MLTAVAEIEEEPDFEGDKHAAAAPTSSLTSRTHSQSETFVICRLTGLLLALDKATLVNRCWDWIGLDRTRERRERRGRRAIMRQLGEETGSLWSSPR